jgi:hypothetical protein
MGGDPGLIILLGILFVLIAPARWMPWFDDNPAYTFANVNDNSLEVYNSDSLLIWSDVMKCDFAELMRERPSNNGEACDLDGNGLNEVVFFPRIEVNCDERGWVKFYSSAGELQFSRFAPVLDLFPADTPGTLFDIHYIGIKNIGRKPIIISTVCQELPARSHIRMWDGKGDSLGWYITRGHCHLRNTVDLDSDGKEELLFLGINNQMNCVFLLALNVDSTKGFSPFNGFENSDNEWYVPGTEYGYVLFPVSDIGNVPGELPPGHNEAGANGILVSEEGLIKVYICESATDKFERSIVYFLNHDLRVRRVVFTDHLETRRENLVGESKLSPIDDWTAYYANLRDTVTYWIDSGWVTEGELRATEGK